MPQKLKEQEKYPHFEDTGLGQRIAQIRSSRGLSQLELAQKIRITRTNLSHYESGRLHVSADILGRLALELKVSADELLGLKGLKSQPFDSIPTNIIKLIQGCLRIPKDKQKSVFGYVRLIVRAWDPEARERTARKKVPKADKKIPAKVKIAKPATLKPVVRSDLPKKHHGAWVIEELEILEMYYPKCEDKSIILDLLPGRSWTECQDKAAELGIKRKVDDAAIAKQKKPKMILAKAKLASLLRQDLPIDEIARRLKTTTEVVRRHMWKYGF